MNKIGKIGRVRDILKRAYPYYEYGYLAVAKEVVDLCGERLEEKYSEWCRHVIKEGGREHVVSYDSNGRHCSVPNCNINKPIKPKKIEKIESHPDYSDVESIEQLEDKLNELIDRYNKERI